MLTTDRFYLISFYYFLRSKFFSYPMVLYNKIVVDKQNLNTTFFNELINKLTGDMEEIITMQQIHA